MILSPSERLCSSQSSSKEQLCVINVSHCLGPPSHSSCSVHPSRAASKPGLFAWPRPETLGKYGPKSSSRFIGHVRTGSLHGLLHVEIDAVRTYHYNEINVKRRLSMLTFYLGLGNKETTGTHCPCNYMFLDIRTSARKK